MQSATSADNAADIDVLVHNRILEARAAEMQQSRSKLEEENGFLKHQLRIRDKRMEASAVATAKLESTIAGLQRQLEEKERALRQQKLSKNDLLNQLDNATEENLRLRADLESLRAATSFTPRSSINGPTTASSSGHLRRTTSGTSLVMGPASGANMSQKDQFALLMEHKVMCVVLRRRLREARQRHMDVMARGEAMAMEVEDQRSYVNDLISKNGGNGVVNLKALARRTSSSAAAAGAFSEGSGGGMTADDEAQMEAYYRSTNKPRIFGGSNNNNNGHRSSVTDGGDFYYGAHRSNFPQQPLELQTAAESDFMEAKFATSAYAEGLRAMAGEMAVVAQRAKEANDKNQNALLHVFTEATRRGGSLLANPKQDYLAALATGLREYNVAMASVVRISRDHSVRLVNSERSVREAMEKAIRAEIAAGKESVGTQVDIESPAVVTMAERIAYLEERQRGAADRHQRALALAEDARGKAEVNTQFLQSKIFELHESVYDALSAVHRHRYQWIATVPNVFSDVLAAANKHAAAAAASATEAEAMKTVHFNLRIGKAVDDERSLLAKFAHYFLSSELFGTANTASTASATASSSSCAAMIPQSAFLGGSGTSHNTAAAALLGVMLSNASSSSPHRSRTASALGKKKKSTIQVTNGSTKNDAAKSGATDDSAESSGDDEGSDFSDAPRRNPSNVQHDDGLREYRRNAKGGRMTEQKQAAKATLVVVKKLLKAEEGERTAAKKISKAKASATAVSAPSTPTKISSAAKSTAAVSSSGSGLAAGMARRTNSSAAISRTHSNASAASATSATAVGVGGRVRSASITSGGGGGGDKHRKSATFTPPPAPLSPADLETPAATPPSFGLPLARRASTTAHHQHTNGSSNNNNNRAPNSLSSAPLSLASAISTSCGAFSAASATAAAEEGSYMSASAAASFVGVDGPLGSEAPSLTSTLVAATGYARAAGGAEERSTVGTVASATPPTKGLLIPSAPTSRRPSPTRAQPKEAPQPMSPMPPQQQAHHAASAALASSLVLSPTTPLTKPHFNTIAPRRRAATFAHATSPMAAAATSGGGAPPSPSAAANKHSQWRAAAAAAVHAAQGGGGTVDDFIGIAVHGTAVAEDDKNNAPPPPFGFPLPASSGRALVHANLASPPSSNNLAPQTAPSSWLASTADPFGPMLSSGSSHPYTALFGPSSSASSRPQSHNVNVKTSHPRPAQEAATITFTSSVGGGGNNKENAAVVSTIDASKWTGGLSRTQSYTNGMGRAGSAVLTGGAPAASLLPFITNNNSGNVGKPLAARRVNTAAGPK